MKKKSILSLILCLTFLLSTFSSIAFAADEATENYYSTAKATWENNKALPANIPDGKVFAGWYADEDLALPVKSAAGFDTNGGAYAKFVDENVLSVYGQILAEITTESDETDLRLLTSVDSDKYQNVGFLFEVNGITQTFTTNKVYTEVYGYTPNGDMITYGPDEFSKESQYIMALSLTGIPRSAFSTEIKVTPTWTTMDGTVVSGDAKIFQINKMVANKSYLDGASLETAADMQYFAPHSTNDGSSYSEISRVTYESVGIEPADNSCGDSLLQVKSLVSVGTESRPTLYINFGKKLPVGAKITYKVMLVNEGVAEGTKVDYYVQGRDSDLKQDLVVKTVEFGQWYTIEVTLKEAGTKLRTNIYTSDTTYRPELKKGITYMYFDDFKVDAHVFTDGTSLETEAEMKYFAPRTEADNCQSEISRVTYQSVGIEPADNSSGDSLLQVKSLVSVGTESRPTLYINFGTTLPANAKITYKVMLVNEGVAEGTKVNYYVQGRDSDLKQELVCKEVEFGQWYTIEVTLKEAGTKLQTNIYTSDATYRPELKKGITYMYFDDFKVHSITDEVSSFETEAHMKCFASHSANDTGKSEISRVTYQSVGIEPADNNCGDSLLQVKSLVTINGSTESRPNLYIHFGRILPAGTKITYKVMLVNDAVAAGTKVFYYLQGPDTYTKDVVVQEMEFGQWYTIEGTIGSAGASLRTNIYTSDSTYRAELKKGTTYMYFDNVEVTLPTE